MATATCFPRAWLGFRRPVPHPSGSPSPKPRPLPAVDRPTSSAPPAFPGLNSGSRLEAPADAGGERGPSGSGGPGKFAGCGRAPGPWQRRRRGSAPGWTLAAGGCATLAWWCGAGFPALGSCVHPWSDRAMGHQVKVPWESHSTLVTLVT